MNIPVERHDLNGRWYAPTDEWWKENGEGDKPFRRSSTTILNVLANGIGYDSWLGNSHGYSAAMDYANERARIGTVVHEIIRELYSGLDLNYENQWYDPVEEQTIALSREIQEYIESYRVFHDNYKPQVIACETSLFNPDLEWAGTADLVCMLDSRIYINGVIGSLKRKYKKASVEYKNWLDEEIAKNERKLAKAGEPQRWLIDFKTGNEYPSHWPQLISYKMAWDSISEEKIDRIGCLYLKSGYKLRPAYKLTEHKFNPELWESILKIDNLMNRPKPSFKLELPDSIKLEV